MRKFHSFLSAACALSLLAADKGGVPAGGPKSKAGDPADGAVTMPPGAETIDTPVSTAAPDTVAQPVADPNEEAKKTYRRDVVDGKPLEIKERPARLAGNIASISGFGGETAQDRADAQAERVKLAAKAEKADDK